MKNLTKTIIFLIICFVSLNQAIQAQTTAFTYQGKLSDGGMSPTAQYDFTFRLFDAPAGGAQVGADVLSNDVQVTAGIFTVNLDFGASPFTSGAERFLQISVRPGASMGAYTPLAPLQPLTSSPYSIKTLRAVSADSLSASCVSCVTDANIDSVGANKVTGVLSYFQGGTGFGGTFLPAGVFLRSNGAGWQASGILASDIPTNLGSYIQNTTTTQATSNFNVSGTGTANIFNAATQYNIGGNRVLSAAGTENFFAGVGAGQNNTGFSNTFVGRNAGLSNAAGVSNSFFGQGAGQSNSTGSFNSFFGVSAGFVNTGGDNSFFGYTAGRNNSSGGGNSFFGKESGNANTAGGSNTFVGFIAGRLNTLGNNNTFLGSAAGDTNTTGSRNTIIGSLADVSTNNLNYATAIGADAVVSSSNTVVLGRNLDTVQIPGNLNVSGNITGTFNGTIATANNALNLGGVPANQYVVTTDPRMADARNPLPNSSNYIQNIPGIGTQSASFNIDGGGNANIFNATTQYNIGAQRMLSAPGAFNTFVGRLAGRDNTGGNNVFVGDSSGVINTTGSSNAFFGTNAGQNNTTGSNNSFFGETAGFGNSAGSNNNSFFGQGAGRSNAASDNAFFGTLAGADNFSGTDNSFFGSNAGRMNSLGTGNAFFGTGAGSGNTTGDANTFFGRYAGYQNSTGRGITLIGNGANIGFDNLFNATAIGVNAVVSQNNSLVLGAFLNGFDTKVGIGTSAPGYRLDVVGRSRFKQESGFTGTGGSAGFWFFQNTPNADQAFVGMENDNSVGLYGNNGGNWGLVMNTQTGVTSVKALGAAGSTNLCRNTNNEISTCSSSIRYKQNINPFDQGLSLIKQLRPVSFNWRANNQADLGLVAEEVASVEPLLTTVNEKGEVEGVKYDRVGVVLINAVQEQQAQIEAQARQIEEQKALIRQQQEKADKQQAEINALKILVCSQNPTAELCKLKEK